MPISDSFCKHLRVALLAGLALRLFFIWRFPTYTGDTKFYEELARNLLDHGVYGLFVRGELTPVDMRAPGYPLFLAGVYAVLGRSRLAVMVMQALVDLGTCVLTAVMAGHLAPESERSRATAAAVWLAALCPFTANYTAVPLTEVLATFLTVAALLVFLRREARPSVFSTRDDVLASVKTWFLGGLVAGIGTLVRPEAPLLLVAVGLVFCFRWRRRADWAKLALATLWMAVGLVVPLVPWAARNARTLGRIQFLAPRYAETAGDYIPVGFHAWTQTWLFRSRDAYVVWKLTKQPIRLEDLPSSAFDSEQERARVAALLARHNEELEVTPKWDREFTQLAGERTARHPLRSYLLIPVLRTTTMWFTPRIALLPYSGELWPPAKRWHDNPADFGVTAGFGLLNFLYVGLALAGTWRSRQQSALSVLAAFILVRTAFMTQLQTTEPRYVVECFPVVLALGAQIWSKGERQSSPAIRSRQILHAVSTASGTRTE